MVFLKNIVSPFLMGIFILANSSANGESYYLDAVKGNDNSSGLSPASSWKSLSKVNKTHFQAGDRILFKSGQTFNGTLVISSSGANEQPIVYETFGGKEPAVVDGGGAASAVYSYNKAFFELKNLAVTNFREGVIGKEDLFHGIYIVNEDAGVLEHIYFENVHVFNVNSTYLALDEGKRDQSRYHGGVLFYTKGSKIPSCFKDILIQNSRFENLSRTGFNFRSDWDDRAAYSRFGEEIGNGVKDNWFPNTEVVIRKNLFRNIAGNGLIVRVARGALIERNLFDSCGVKISGNAVFNFNTDNTVYQFNEARNTVYNEGDTDARGIDSDYRTKNTIIQYNYLHHNGLGGVTATGGPGVGENPVNFNLGTIIRYNVIENNARQGAYFSGRVEGLQVYNNVFFSDSTLNDVVVLKLNRWTVYPNGAFFKNNIFYVKGDNPSFSFGNSTNISFSNNLYYGVLPPTEFPDKSPLISDPLFESAGNGPTGYKLKDDSPAAGKGVIIKDNGGRDYFGNPLQENATGTSIGICTIKE